MRCYKCDEHNESACEHAKASLMMGDFECTNPCVLMAHKAMLEAAQKCREAEAKLHKYREAVRPIVQNCRAILDALEAESKATNETKTEDNK